jgi:uncharacterized membrane protein YhaH (DUF805 family)
VQTVATLRIVFIVLAFAFGIWLAAAGVLSALELLVTGGADSDSPPPFSFSNYVYIPAISVVVLVGAVAALKRRWEALTLTCWFLAGAVIVDVFDAAWNFGWGRVPPTVGSIWTFLALLGLVLAGAARQRGEPRIEAAPSPSRQERIRLRNTLVSLVVVSYLWRAIFIALNPAAAGAIAILRGISGVYLLVNGVIALGAALVLLVCAVASFRAHDRLMNAALAFTAGLSFEGSLDALDFALTGGARLEIMYALQDAVAFVACCCALALSVRPAHESSRLPA